MKHVFGIASNLAFYVSNKIVETDGLNREDCIFLLLRGYQIPPDMQSLYPHQIATDYNTNMGKGRIFAGVNVWRTHRNMQAFDALVDAEIKGDTFVWYTQVCSNDICSMMVSKPNCMGYYVIEDGTASYMPVNRATFTGVRAWVYHCLLRPLYPRIFCVKNHAVETKHPKFKGCIGTSEKTFPLFQEHLRVIGNPFVPEYAAVTPDALISVDALYFYLNDEDSERIFRKLGETLQEKKYQCVAYKHHPYVLAAANRAVYEKYEQWIQQYIHVPVVELAASACLENLATAYRCDFYTVFSSVAIYAHEAGCTCYSLLPMVEDRISVQFPLINDICTPIQ